MKSPIPDYLAIVLNKARSIPGGAPADYIETLAKADTSKIAVAVATVDGNLYSVGDDEIEFSIQSISKAFVYAMAIEDVGLAAVQDLIGVEPSGDAFNKLSLEKGGRGPRHRPMNPMINVGALAAHSLVRGATASERVSRILDQLSRLAGRELHVDEVVCAAELGDANRNMGLAYMLKAAGILTAETDPREVVEGYIRQCSISVTVRDLAMMAATLANAGLHPVSGEALMPRDSVRQVLAVMTTCGMYDWAGDWVSRVGIPAKSGVAGGIIGALPGQVGIATFSPGLDVHGNSVRGVALFEKLSRDIGLHMMDVSQIGKSTVRTAIATVVGGEHYVTADGGGGESKPRGRRVPCAHPNDGRTVVIFSLRGAVRFPGAERLSRAVARELGAASEGDGDDGGGGDPLAGQHADACAVVFSLKEVFSLNTVARLLILEIMRRVDADGKAVVVIDPSSVLRRPEGEEEEGGERGGCDVGGGEGGAGDDGSVALDYGRAGAGGGDYCPHVVASEDEAREFLGGRGGGTSVVHDAW